jgi:anti-sigma factor RsiW
MAQDPTQDPISAEELHAFMDGELDDARADEIARRLETDPELTRTVEAYRGDQDLLVAHYAPVLAQPLPVAWINQIAAAGRSSPASRFRKIPTAGDGGKRGSADCRLGGIPRCCCRGGLRGRSCHRGAG